MSYPGYPGQYPQQPGQPGAYPPQYPGQQAYPPQQPGYPAQPNPYPPVQGYPQQPGYPPAPGGYPAAPAYPPQPGYPAQPAYPPQQGYPAGQPAYPPQQGAQAAPQYPPQYPPQQAYPQQGAYPQQPYPAQGAYPPAPGAYPPQTGYPQQGAPAYPPQAPGAAPVHGVVGAIYTSAKYTGPGYGQPGWGTVPVPGTAESYVQEQCNPAFDSSALYGAMKGLGTNEKKLIEIIGNRTPENLALIRQEFEKTYNKSLASWIEGETSGKFRYLLQNLITPIVEVKAGYVYDAIEGVGTKESHLIDVLCQSSNAEIEVIKQIYAIKFYGKKPRKKGGFHAGGPDCLANDIKDDCSFNFEKILLECLRGQRDENPYVNEAQVQEDVEKFYRAGEGKVGTDDSIFISLIANRSVAHLERLDVLYRAKHHKGITDVIRHETSGYYRDALIALTKRPAVYFAERINKAVAGAGTDDGLLIYCLTVNNHKTRWQQLCTEYQKINGKSMEHHVKGDVSGDYGKLILAMFAHNM